jgi:hypothetical protein
MPSAAADDPPAFKNSRRFQNEPLSIIALLNWGDRSGWPLAPQNYIDAALTGAANIERRRGKWLESVNRSAMLRAAGIQITADLTKTTNE